MDKLSLLVAVSYHRVSSKAQTAEGRSGLDRQEQALQRWLLDHPGYQLEDRLVDAGVSGGGKNRKFGALGWFLKQGHEGRWQPGTVLVVETFSRFSRERITDVMKTLLELWDLGLAIAFCDQGGEILTSLEQGSGTVYRVIGAADQAHREWLEKRDRAKGSSEFKRRLIREGQKPFLERSKEKQRSDYPFWLDFNAKENTFKENKHANWVSQVFLWAQDVGSTTIAQRLKAQGVRSPVDGKKFYTAPSIVSLLRNPAVIGSRQLYTGNKPVGEPLPGVYPPIISEDNWKLARKAIEHRHAGQAAVASPKMHNLFQKRIFCAHCQGLVGVYRSEREMANGEKKAYPYLRCMNGHYDKEACPARRRTYQEDKILKRFQTFRWSDYFSDQKHGLEVTAARAEQLRAEDARNAAKLVLLNVKTALRSQVRSRGTIESFLEDELAAAEREYNEADLAVNRASLALATLQRRKTGHDAEKAIQGRIADFLSADRDDVSIRQDFNRWLFSENLVIEYNFEADAFEVGKGFIDGQGRLLELDQRLDDAAAFGIDIGDFRRIVDDYDKAIEGQLADPKRYKAVQVEPDSLPG